MITKTTIILTIIDMIVILRNRDSNEVNMMTTQYDVYAKKFKAFCDSNRLRILALLENKELCACELLDTFEVSQSTLSYHMKILVDSGIVKARKDGKWSHYSISKSGMEEIKAYLMHIK